MPLSAAEKAALQASAAALVAKINALKVDAAAPPPPPAPSMIEGKVTVPYVNSAKPAKNVPISGEFGLTARRVTDHTADGTNTFARNDYSRRQAFNANNTRQVVYAFDGYWHLYDATTHARIKTLPGLAGDAEPEWHPTDPALMYFFPNYGIGMQIKEVNVETGAIRTLADLGARLKARWPTANSAWTKSEGSPSKDARYWCLIVYDAGWSALGLITFDLTIDAIVAYRNLTEKPDHVSMSPSGLYAVVSGASGTLAWTRDLTASFVLQSRTEHSDIAIDANGDDVYVSVDYAATGNVFMVNLRTKVRTDLFPSYVAGTATALHFSGKGYGKPGWVLVSTYGDYGGAQQWLHKKVFICQLAANPKIYNLAHTHAVDNGYWPEPQASISRDFTRAVWTSNWGVNSDLDVDVYEVQIPAF